MKSLFLSIALLASGLALAHENRTEENFNANVLVRYNKIRCTIFGNLKIKLLGLEAKTGRLGKGWMKAQKTEQKCRLSKLEVTQQIRTRANQPAKVKLVKTISYREEWRSYDNWGWHHDFGWHLSPIHMSDYYYSVRCSKVEESDLTTTLPEMKVAGQALILKASAVKVLDVRYGRCPQGHDHN